MGTLEMYPDDRGPQGIRAVRPLTICMEDPTPMPAGFLADEFIPKKAFAPVADASSGDGRFKFYADKEGRIHSSREGGVRVIILGTGLTDIVGLAVGDICRIAVLCGDGTVSAWWYDDSEWNRYVHRFPLPVPLADVRDLRWVAEKRDYCLEILTDTCPWQLKGNRLTRRWKKRQLPA